MHNNYNTTTLRCINLVKHSTRNSLPFISKEYGKRQWRYIHAFSTDIFLLSELAYIHCTSHQRPLPIRNDNYILHSQPPRLSEKVVHNTLLRSYRNHWRYCYTRGHTYPRFPWNDLVHRSFQIFKNKRVYLVVFHQLRLFCVKFLLSYTIV